MAFAGIFMILLVIYAVIFLSSLITGLILLIIGIKRKKNPKNKGKKSPVVMIVIGALILSFPVGMFINGIARDTIRSIKLNSQRKQYENITDEWRNSLEFTTGDSAADDAVKELLTSADNNDIERFKKTFTKSIQNSEDFEEYITEFFSKYPSGLSQCELDGEGRGEQSSSNYGNVEKYSSGRYTCKLNDEIYYINFNFCYANTDNPDEVGVSFFSLENLQAYAERKQYENKPLVCNIKSKDEINVVYIDGEPYAYKDIPERKLNSDDFADIIGRTRNISELKSEIGEPNVCEDDLYIYGLEPEFGVNEYAEMYVDDYGRITSAYICDEEEVIIGIEKENKNKD